MGFLHGTTRQALLECQDGIPYFIRGEGCPHSCCKNHPIYSTLAPGATMDTPDKKPSILLATDPAHAAKPCTIRNGLSSSSWLIKEVLGESSLVNSSEAGFTAFLYHSWILSLIATCSSLFSSPPFETRSSYKSQVLLIRQTSHSYHLAIADFDSQR